MGYDRKFGVVTTERRSIPREEPVFLIRAKDAAAPAAIRAYAAAARDVGAGADVLDPVMETAELVERWQAEHPELVRAPDTEPGEIRADGALGLSDDDLKGTGVRAVSGRPGA